jgi:hypothetical protein
MSWHSGVVIFLAMIVACNGPNETAGKEQDKAAAAALGQAYSGSGPNQRIGEAKDRAVSARKEADEAAAKALSAKGDEIKRQADVEAASLDEQSRAIRDAANKRAAALKEAGTEAK